MAQTNTDGYNAVGKYSEADEGLHSDASEVSDMSTSRFSVRSTQSEQPNRSLRSQLLSSAAVYLLSRKNCSLVGQRAHGDDTDQT